MFKSRGIRNFTTLLFLLICFGLAVRFIALPRVFPMRYQKMVMQYAAEFGVEPSLVYGVIHTESKFRPGAVSAKQAKGLMQITDGTGEWAAGKLGLAEYSNMSLYNPEINIRIGCWYLNNLNNQFHGNWDTTLAAYNAGSGNVSKWLANAQYSQDGSTLSEIPFEETKNYVKRVKRTQKIYQWFYGIS